MIKTRFWSVVKRFMEPALHDKKKLILLSSIYLLWRIYEFANVYAFSQIISSIDKRNISNFEGALLGFLIFICIYQVGNFCLYRFAGFYEIAMYRYINEKYLPKLIEVDNNYIESLGSAKVMTIFTKGMDYWSQFTERLISRSISILVMLVMTGIMLSRVSWMYFAILLGVSLLFNSVALRFKDIGLKYRAIKYDLVADYNRKVLRYIMSKHEIMQNNRGYSEAGNIGEKISHIEIMDRKKWPFEHVAFNSMEVGITIVKLAIMFGIGKMVFGGQASMGELVGIVTLIGYLSSTSQSFIDMIGEYMKNGVNLTRFWEFLDTAPRIKNLHIGKKYSHSRGNIEIKNLSYSYERNKIFDDFSLTLPGCTQTAFVGASGSGKSTLIKLIAGYLSPHSGDVFIDGNALSSIKLSDYYKKVGYLTQDPSIFDGTIYDNLVYSLDVKPSLDEVEKVISLAKCEFVYEFEKGLDTEIGERGVRLSGGQRQRLAIAKIMLKNPDIILLDEPTSALDSFNEEQISIALRNLFEGKTVIIVAHRLQTVKNANQIFVFEHGKIVEQGTHEELTQIDGRYRQMFELQGGI